MTTLADQLGAGRVLLLDGAISTELQRRGVPMSSEAWSGAAALTHPDEVRALHADYIRAGADVITTNTYASARCHLAGVGLDERVREVNRAAVALAREACERAGAERPVWIAGSMSLMAPGFDARLRPRVDESRRHFAEQAGILAEAGVDLLLLEMLRDIEYSRAALEEAVATGLPVCAGFSCVRESDDSLMMSQGVGHPLPLADVLEAVLGRGEAIAGIMHSDIGDTAAGLELLRRRHHGPLAAYPNSGHFEPPNWSFDGVVTPGAFAEAAAGWVDLGARLVGGCCGIGPEHIAALRARLPHGLQAS